jgi:hypothetical protein
LRGRDGVLCADTNQYTNASLTDGVTW